MKQRGRPVLGAFSGFCFGLFLSLTLLAFGVVALDNILVTLLPVLGLVAVGALAMWFPIGRSSSSS